MEELKSIPRSRLYHLKPVGLGTSYVESITSFVSRLAKAHCVTVGSLVIKEILPLFDRIYLTRNISNISTFWKGTPSFLGVSIAANDFVTVLENLTTSTNLRLLTMLPWSEVISWRGLIKRNRAWCPECLEEWKQLGQELYKPLIWSIEIVKFCPRHYCKLQVQCPNPKCNKIMPHLSSFSIPGYCSLCGEGLGTLIHKASTEVGLSEINDSDWLKWSLCAVEELIKNEALVKNILTKATFATIFTTLVNNLMSENNSQAARQLGVSDVTILDWKRGKQIPQLGTLLQICYQLDITPFDLLITNKAASFPKNKNLKGYSPWCRPTKHYRKFEEERIQQTLLTELRDNQKPPSSMTEIGKRLGYDQSHIYRHFPDLVIRTTDKHKVYKYKLSTEKASQFLVELQRAIDKIHEQGYYPSRRRISLLLTKPSYLRRIEAADFCRQCLEELGYKISFINGL